MSVLLRVRDLEKVFRRPSLLDPDARNVHALRGVSFELERGETLGIVGESGSGKSTLARVVLRLVFASGGRVDFDGENIAEMRAARLLRFRKRAQIVFQDAHSALDPRMTVGRSIEEGMLAHGIGRDERRRRAAELFELVGLAKQRINDYPHEFSGGQRQRIVIARALAVGPELLILDEPVSSLDVSIQAQILNLLADLKSRLDLTYIFISHDLNLVGYLADRIGVMRGGELVELAPAGTLLGEPRHEYTKSLFRSSPRYVDRRVIAPL